MPKKNEAIVDIPRPKLDEILFQALRAIYHFERSKIAGFDLTYEAIYLLQYLRRHSSVPMSALAGEMKMPISTVTRLVDRLQGRDLIHREKDHQDKRIIRVMLSPAGEHLVEAVEAHTYERVAANMARFKPEDFQAFLKTAVYLQKILGPEDIWP